MNCEGKVALSMTIFALGLYLTIITPNHVYIIYMARLVKLYALNWT